ncbi:MAG: cytochrome ubiquinol oxidase subunit I [Deltaproteobacteria bacterium]|jgi:cytochrome d ubiquinol oxidase subunit I|nr:cytochrome ubiquinol oxidase subunit I [Deltaproteobacteria bacterium]
MDALMLSRLQFAAATFFHFLFVPLTLGLSVLLAIMETAYVRTGNEEYRRMARFWGKIFLINFAIGVVTGITLEFQFGTNWSRYSEYVGDIFGSLLAIEATVAFFLESTFVAVWAFGWKRLSPKAHAITIWLVAFASNLSAIWILIANSWMQNPVGYVIKNGRAQLYSLTAVITQPFAWYTIAHTISAAYILASFFVMGVSAWHLLKKNEISFFKKSFRIAVTFALIFTIVEVVQGDMHAGEVAKYQPAKLAAMESLWNTTKSAPEYLFAIPDPARERNIVQFGKIPGLLSFLAYRHFDAEVKGLKAFPRSDRPPVIIPYFSFRIMVALGFFFLVTAIIGFIRRNSIEAHSGLLKVFLFAIPLPYLACECGWMLTEVGRQPWVVYGLMKTSQAVSPIAASQVGISLAAFVVVYAILGIIAFRLMLDQARKGPQAETALPESADEEVGYA